jgi:hypothetical protein
VTFVASFHLGVVRHALGTLDFPRAAAIHENLAGLRESLAAPPEDALSRRIYDSIPMPLFDKARDECPELNPARTLLWNVSGPDFRAARDAGVAGVIADDVPEMLRVFQNNA